MKARVLILTVLLTLASGVTASAITSLSAHSYCGTNCGQMGAIHGSGTLVQSGTGITFGTVGSGTIAITDRSNDGVRDYSVGGWDRTWTKSGTVYFKGKGMSYRVWTSWRVRITASWGISTSTTATGKGFIKGSGSSSWASSGWSLNGSGGPDSSNWPLWPTAGKSFTIKN
jgi:hypothetical protein